MRYFIAFVVGVLLGDKTLATVTFVLGLLLGFVLGRNIP